METTYRAWDDRNKKWLLGYEEAGGFSLFGECVLFGEWARVLDVFTFEKEGLRFSDLIVTLWTGRKDVSGKLIYQGDFDINGDVVHWCEECLAWQMAVYDKREFIFCHNCDGHFMFTDHIDNFEIASNIFETSEN